MPRFVSDAVAVIVLIAAVVASFAVAGVVAPRYLSQYAGIGMQVGAELRSSGIQTEAQLVRAGDRLVVLLYNFGEAPVAVSYYVLCNSTDGYFLVSSGSATVRPGEVRSLVVRGTGSPPCYLLVEESNVVTYKVLES